VGKKKKAGKTSKLDNHGPLPVEQQKTLIKKKRRLRQRRIRALKFAAFYILIFILLWVIIEFIAFKFGIHLWHLLKGVGIFTAVLPILLKLFKLFLPSEETSEVPLARPPDMDIIEHAKMIGKHIFIKCIWQNTLLIIGLLAAFLLVGTAFAAERQWGKHLKDWVLTPAVEDADVEDNENTSDLQTNVPSGDQIIENTTEIQKNPGQNNDETESKEEPSIVSQLISAQDLLLNAEEPEALTGEEYDQIFFKSGDYFVDDWSKDNVQMVVHAFVQDKRAIQSSPNYDMVGIPQPVRDAISIASRKEAVTSTAIQLSEVINIRKNAYGEPEEGKAEVNTSYTLAKLLRENYGVYGDAYNYQEASDSAAYALYGRSIIWGFKRLNYASKSRDFCKDLEVIAERYQKIAAVVPVNSQEFIYADLLCDAFLNEADRY